MSRLEVGRVGRAEEGACWTMEMGASRKLITSLMLLVLGTFPGHSQLYPVSNVEVTRGGRVVLPASYKPTSDIKDYVIVWNFNVTKQVITYTSAGVGTVDLQFFNRVEFFHKMPSTNISIVINNTQEADSGQYNWQVVVPRGTGYNGEVKLTVNIPPSVPVCTMTGQPVLMGNITLNCNSAEGKPAPLYRWNKSSPNSMLFFPPMLSHQLGTLKLTNLTSNMSGKYTCQASNAAGAGVCYIELEVSTVSNAGVIAGATIGALLGLVAIVFFVYFILKRKKESEDDIANDIKEDAQAPKRISWAKSGTGSDSFSKNGTLSSIITSPIPQDHLHIQSYPVSDTASIITATGSMAGYRLRPGEINPGLHAGPGYNGSFPRAATGPHTSNGNSLQRPEPARAPRPSPPAVPTSSLVPPISTGVTSSNITRMGGVPVMVPAQNQAGSLV
ncbi:endothelial cell-selective adhesion molecule [Paramormyrops kingsleyae]|uniref:endothelial cell-selective adhesion molecule n=1 Tax=Paramormyrops kingsleyae TaxID=1676925 RepID=UPI003B976164